MHSKMFNYSSLIRAPPGLLRPPSLELIPIILRDPAPALSVGRLEDRRIAVLHPVATHGFAAVVLLVQGREAHDVPLQVRKSVPSDDGRAARRHPRLHNCIVHRATSDKVHGGRSQVLDAAPSQALFRAVVAIEFVGEALLCQLNRRLEDWGLFEPRPEVVVDDGRPPVVNGFRV